MSDDELITRRELGLTIENLSLTVANEVGALMDRRMEVWEKRWDEVSSERYRANILELTGENPENKDRIRAGHQYAMKAAEDEIDTRRKFKGAVIGFSLPSIAAGMAWFIEHFKTGGN